MIKALKNKYALSNQGAKDLLKGIIYSVLANISLMFPVFRTARCRSFRHQPSTQSDETSPPPWKRCLAGRFLCR